MAEEGVKFIRVRGRVIPIRKDKGTDLRSKGSANYGDYKATYKDAKKRTKSPSLGKRAATSATFGIAGAGIGAHIGGAIVGAAGFAARKLLGKGAGGLAGATKGGAIGAAAIGLLGAYAGATREGASARTWNKLAGQHAAKRLQKKSKTGV